MSNFLTTLKYSIINSFAINKLRKKDDTTKFSFPKILLLIVLAIFVYASSYAYIYLFGFTFNEANQPEVILSLGIIASIFMSLLITITNATGFLFKSKDFDLLMSLPIKQNTIVLTKITYLLIINYIIFSLIYIPAIIIYAIFIPTNAIYWVFSILTFFIGPFLPVAVSVLLAYILSIIIPKFKYKNLITILFSLFLITFIMVISFMSSMVEEDPTSFIKSLNSILRFTGEWAYNGIRGDYLEFLYFVLVSVIPFVLFTRIIGKFYLKANTKFASATSKSNYKMEELEVKSQGFTLIKKELRRYFNSPMYVLNTIVGPLLSTIMVVLLGIALESTLADAGIDFSSFPYLGAIVVSAIVFSLGITSTTASSISIEGKQFWILKSAPISPKKIFHGKIFINLVITVPFIIINTVIAIFLFDLLIIDYLMIFFIPLLFTIFMSYLGLLVNLKFPRFDYENDMKAVKQSLSVLVTMGIGFVIVTVIFVLAILIVQNTKKLLLAYLGAFLFILIITSIVVTLLYKVGVKLYKKLVI